MKVTYQLGWMKRGRTPGMFRAMVHEIGTPNWVERLIGKDNYTKSDEYIGHNMWFRDGTKVRAKVALEEFLSKRTMYADAKRGGGIKCALQFNMITFKRG